MTRRRVLEGVLHPEASEPVALLPFEVPANCVRITLRYRHDAGHILDLGLLDPAAAPFPSAEGFRGWSGGARREATVGLRDATPGYLAGELPAGLWHVMLGRAHVGTDGCAYRVEIDVERDDAGRAAQPLVADVSEAPLEAAAIAPIDVDAPWYPGDLQSHTHHSDAQGSVDELLSAARSRGLRFLAVTDHNTVSHHADLRRHAVGPVLPVPGMEVTTYRGHANVWGARGWVDFRIASDADVPRMVRRAHDLGGLVSVNHPKRQPGCIGCDWTYPVPGEADALEAWQGPWWLRNWESLARYDALLARGHRLTLVGGSDRHQPAGPETDPDVLRVGSPTTWLQLARLSVPNVLQALRSGRAAVSESPVGPRIELASGVTRMGDPLPPAAAHRVTAVVLGADGERLRWMSARGPVREVPIVGARFEDTWAWTPDGPYLRAEVVAEGSLPRRLAELAAWTERRPLPYGITLEEVHAHPWALALGNPLYA